MSDFEEMFQGLNFIKKTGNYATAQTRTAVWTPASGRRIVLMGVELSSDTAMNIQLEEGGADIVPPQYIGATGGVVIGFGNYPVWVGGVDAVITATSSTTGNHSILLVGLEI